MTLSGAGRILIVDDDEDTRWLLAHACEKANYAVGEAGSGQEALAKLRAEPFDVMLLDLRLPDMNGVEVLDEIAEEHPHLITIVLTANPSQDSAIAAIRIGVADYLSKPLRIKDVLEAIARKLAQRAMWQRRLIELGLIGNQVVGEDAPQNGRGVELGIMNGGMQWRQPRVQLDPATNKAKVLGEEAKQITLTKGESAVLRAFLRNLGEVLSYQDLAYEAWGDELEPDHAASILRPLIFRLRQKLEPDPSIPSFIRTVRGEGYMFNPD